MAKQKIVPRAPHDDEIPDRRKPNWVVRAGIGIVGLAVAASSLLPILSYFDRSPAPAPVADDGAAKIEQLAEAAKAYPKNASLQLLLGNAYYDRKEYAQSAAAYQQALALKPNDPDVKVDYGTSLYYSGKAKAAIAAYQDVIAKHPDHFKAHLDLGVVYESQGHVDEARKAWTVAEMLAPDANAKQEIGTMIAALSVTTKKH